MNQDIEIYNKYYGREDEYINNVTSNIITGDYIDTRTYILQGSNETTSQEILLSNVNDVISGYGYSNIKLVGNLDTTDEIKLEIGGTNIDIIYPKRLGQTVCPISDMTILPALKLHEYKLYVTYSDTIKINVDIFKLIKYQENDSN